MTVEGINEKFFGDEKTRRYLLDVYRECVEKLIVANVLVEVWAKTKSGHGHTKGRNCNTCAVFFQIYFSCVDSMFLHLRLLFSRQEPALADSFLKSVKGLVMDDYRSYYDAKYEYEINEVEQKVIEPLFPLTKDNLSKISTLYLKRIEPYQAFAFHQPKDGKYYKVTTGERAEEGMKYVTYTLSRKFKHDLRPAKEMLELLAEVIHLYLKVSSKYYHVLKIYPQNYVKEMVWILGVEQVGDEAIDNMIANATKNTEKMIHVIECSGGLNSHNGLIFKKIELAQRTNGTC